MKSKLAIIKLYLKTVRFALKKSKIVFIVPLLIDVINAFSYGAVTLLTANFFNNVNFAIIGKAEFSSVYISLIWLFLGLCINQIMKGLNNSLTEFVDDFYIGCFSNEVIKKCNTIDPVYYEDYHTLNSIEKAKQGAEDVVLFLFVPIMMISFYIPYYLFLGTYFVNLDPLLLIIFPLIFLPILISHILRVRIFSRLVDETAPIKRQVSYYRDCLCGRSFFKETRVLHGVDYFWNLLSGVMNLFIQKRWKAQRKAQLIEILLSLLTLSGYGAIIYILITSFVNGNIAAGDFVAIIASIGTMYAIMRQIINSNFGEVADSMGSVESFFNFLNLPKRKASTSNKIPPNDEYDIQFQDVSFTYPGAESPSLSHINLTIKKGESIALVGANGSGKTTLVRLLMGLYPPSSGECYILNTATASDNKVSALFQNYQRYQFTLEDNIAISDIAKITNPKDLNGLLAKVGVDVKSSTYPKGLKTMLSREFNGVDISGGQWQRVAMARALYRDAEILYLDEPTSAIDPIEESSLYKVLLSVTKEKTAIFVTHRLALTRYLDKIIVLDKGKIVESGSHEELMTKQGVYCEMYQNQAKWYI